MEPNYDLIENFVYFLIFVLMPLAFIHGWYQGKSAGVQSGADGMFEVMWLKGTPIPGEPNKRMVELEK